MHKWGENYWFGSCTIKGKLRWTDSSQELPLRFNFFKALLITTSHIVIFAPWHSELSFDSNKVLVMSWLSHIQNFPCSISFWCMSWCGKRRTFYIGSLWAKPNSACGDVLIYIWPSMHRSRKFLSKPPHQLQTCTGTYQTWKVMYAINQLQYSSWPKE
jgi:hypothetical protein